MFISTTSQGADESTTLRRKLDIIKRLWIPGETWCQHTRTKGTSNKRGLRHWRVGRWRLLQIYWTSLMLATKRKRQSLLYSTIKIFTIDITQAYVFQNETWPRRSNHLHLHRPEWHPGKWMVIPWGESRLNRNNKTHTDIRQLIVPPKKWLKKLCIDRWQIGIFV